MGSQRGWPGVGGEEACLLLLVHREDLRLALGNRGAHEELLEVGLLVSVQPQLVPMGVQPKLDQKALPRHAV